jgi:hypothetical protein
MNFRQRVSWVLVALYLAATAGLVYYVFEISERFNQYALDHISRYRGDGGGGGEHSGWHLADVPAAVVALVVVVPYLQVFCVLHACTQPDPRFSLASLWPVRLYNLCHQAYTRRYQKPVNCPAANGHALIDT